MIISNTCTVANTGIVRGNFDEFDVTVDARRPVPFVTVRDVLAPSWRSDATYTVEEFLGTPLEADMVGLMLNNDRTRFLDRYAFTAAQDFVRSLNRWVPACGGTETWTRYADGREYLYVWNPGTGQHGYLDRADIVHETLPACATA